MKYASSRTSKVLINHLFQVGSIAWNSHFQYHVFWVLRVCIYFNHCSPCYCFSYIYICLMSFGFCHFLPLCLCFYSSTVWLKLLYIILKLQNQKKLFQNTNKNTFTSFFCISLNALLNFYNKILVHVYSFKKRIFFLIWSTKVLVIPLPKIELQYSIYPCRSQRVSVWMHTGVKMYTCLCVMTAWLKRFYIRPSQRVSEINLFCFSGNTITCTSMVECLVFRGIPLLVPVWWSVLFFVEYDYQYVEVSWQC